MEKDAKIAIIGYGLEGRALTKYLTSKGFYNITICDTCENIDDIPQNIHTQCGSHYLENLDHYDYIFRSPGISCLNAKLLPHKNKVTSLMNFFMEVHPGYSIGVTGTKGKGTTSTLIHKLLETEGKESFLGGNIGVPVTEFLEDLTGESFSVLELSSFQLQDLKRSPNISVILNITTDHLDYHADREEYIQAKLPIVSSQKDTDFIIINEDYETPQRFIDETPSGVYTVSTKHEVSQGAFVFNDKIFLRMKDSEETYVMKTEEVGLLGPHNLENILPAITVASLLGVSLETIKQVVAEFTGLPHRLEFIEEINGVRYFNDSFSTAPETAIAAINSFPEGATHILLGGSEKYSDYTELGKHIVETLSIPLCYGETGPRIKEAILEANPSYPVHEANSMEEALETAERIAKEDDVVLLSPASASFDLFPNYKVRGITFIEEVKKMKVKKTSEVLV